MTKNLARLNTCLLLTLSLISTGPCAARKATTFKELYAEGLMEFNATNFPKALQTLRAANKINARSGDVHFYIARCLLYAKQDREALKHMDLALQLKPSLLPDAYWSNMMVLLQTGRFDDAISFANSCKTKYPERKKDSVQFEAEARDFKSSNFAPYSYPVYLTSQDKHRWNLDRMPLRVKIMCDDSTPSRQKIFHDDSIRALDMWCAATDNALNYRLVDSGPVDLSIKLLTEGPDTKKHAWTDIHYNTGDQFYGPSDRKEFCTAYGTAINYPDIKSAEIYIMRPADARMVLQLLTHEVGHAIGLNHSNNADDALSILDRIVYRTTLSVRDKNTVRAVYLTSPQEKQTSKDK